MRQETPEQARTRRRWISLAEAVAVAGVLIAGLTLYLGWADRRAERAEQAAAKQAESRTARVVTLRATRRKDGERLELRDAAHPVDAIDVTFPGALALAPRTGLTEATLEADWLKPADKLLTAGDRKAGRLPVLIASTFWEGETRHVDRAVYDVTWKSEGGLFGHSLKLEGLVLRERGGSQARIDALWRAQSAPAK